MLEVENHSIKQVAFLRDYNKLSDEASLEEDELDLMVLLKQQGLTLILVIFEKDFDDSDDVLDLVIFKGVVLMF